MDSGLNDLVGRQIASVEQRGMTINLVTVEPRRPVIKQAKERGMNWINSTNVPCQYCGHTWHKHDLWCPHYASNSRCRVQHRYFLRSCDASRPEGRYEYECNHCSVPPVFMNEEMPRQVPHPFCAEGFHYWTTCGESCSSCGVWCSGCGKEGTWDNLRTMMLLDYGAHETTIILPCFNERRRLSNATEPQPKSACNTGKEANETKPSLPRSGCI